MSRDKVLFLVEEGEVGLGVRVFFSRVRRKRIIPGGAVDPVFSIRPGARQVLSGPVEAFLTGR